MVNSKERQKILEQIAEWKRNSVNYFDVEKEFFLIDSNNLSEIKTRFYGYSIQQTGIYEDCNLTPEAIAGLDGRGCYVYVEVKDEQITISQDLNGCWGIYLFRQGDYFALSNSFFRLLDYVKFRYPLTVNRDYCHYLTINDVCSHAYSETAINEISLVERNAVLHIDTVKKNLQIELIDYREYTIPLDSETGIETLDNWVEIWSDVLRGVMQNTKSFQVDLSGGFDTRVSFALLLNSDINFDKIRIYSTLSDQHCFPEDYDIASKIANHYGLKLNKSVLAKRTFNYSLTDCFNIDLYSQQTFHNLPTVFWIKNNVDKHYCLRGLSGETLRGYLRKSPQDFIRSQSGKINPYSSDLSYELFNSVNNILKSSFNAVANKYHIKDDESENIPQYFYQETRVRHHYGKECLSSFLKNMITLSPALDPKIRTVQLETTECPDPKLLIALLFTRYEPDLLKFPFEGGRFIAPETIGFAQKLNESFPRRIIKKRLSGEERFHLQPCDTRAEKILASKHNNPDISKTFIKNYLKIAFDSSKTYGLFTSYFDAELYNYAAFYYDNHIFGCERPLYAILGVTRILEDVEISNRNRPLYRDMEYLIEQDFCKIPVDDNDQIIHKFSRYFTARVHIKLLQKINEEDFQIISISDAKAKVTKPEWFQKNGIGYIIHSYAGKLELVIKTTVEGQLQISLLGLYVLDPKDKSKRIPYWIDYTSLNINENTIFGKLTPAWHDKPYRYVMDVKAGEEITVRMEWLPHHT